MVNRPFHSGVANRHSWCIPARGVGASYGRRSRQDSLVDEARVAIRCAVDAGYIDDALGTVALLAIDIGLRRSLGLMPKRADRSDESEDQNASTAASCTIDPPHQQRER